MKIHFSTERTLKYITILYRFASNLIIMLGIFGIIKPLLFWMITLLMFFLELLIFPAFKKDEFYKNLPLLKFSFIVQAIVFFSAIYSLMELQVSSYTKATFWALSFLIFLICFILIDGCRKFYKWLSIRKSDNRKVGLIDNVIILVITIAVLAISYQRPVALDINSIKEPSGLTYVAVLNTKYNIRNVINITTKVEDTTAVNQVFKAIDDSNTTNLKYLDNFKYYLDLATSDVCYKYNLLYEGVYDNRQTEDVYIDCIAILPNYNVYLEVEKRKYTYQLSLYNTKYIRYKIDLPENLVKELIEYANKQGQ